MAFLMKAFGATIKSQKGDLSDDLSRYVGLSFIFLLLIGIVWTKVWKYRQDRLERARNNPRDV